jgi:hypothetical protein
MRRIIQRNTEVNTLNKFYMIFILLSLFLLVDERACAFSCGGKIVSTGDTTADVMLKCGKPAWQDSRQEEVITQIDLDTKRKTVVTIDEWTYNFGPDAFVRSLKFANGRLVDIKEGGYGKTDRKSSDTQCDEKNISLGDAEGEVFIKCGEPTWKDSRQEETIEQIDADTKRKVTVMIDEWTYNLGPNKFVRIMIFRNDKLVDIKTGDYGY